MTAVLPLRTPATARALPPAAPAVLRTLRAAPAFTGRWSVRLLVAVAVLAFAVLAAGPHLLGYRTMTMLTASMAPGIDPGDVVISTPLAVTDVTEGMVISYHIPVDDHRVVTHRVIDVQHAPDGAVTVRTKGDANDHPDPWTAVLQGDTAYQVRAVLPAVGHLITALRTPAVNHALVYGVPALLAGWLLLGIWRPESDAAPDERDAGGDEAVTPDPATGDVASAPRTAWAGGLSVYGAIALLSAWLLLGGTWGPVSATAAEGQQ
ncbi:signal peptidase I [Geodermatophilus sp. SYSU D01176]